MMNRREFIQLSSYISALSASGALPLLAAEPKRKKRTVPGAAKSSSSTNIFTEPCAIEPITGYLPQFKLIDTGSMSGDFSARYGIIDWNSVNLKTSMSSNKQGGELSVRRKTGPDIIYYVDENRGVQSSNKKNAVIECSIKTEEVLRWKVFSEAAGANAPTARFAEDGFVEAGKIIQKSKMGQTSKAAEQKLIAQWAILSLLSRGKIKSEKMSFDMLQDCSIIKRDQKLWYTGEITVLVKGVETILDCYAQIGRGILPTHYLVDGAGRVHLVTQEQVSWALQDLQGG